MPKYRKKPVVVDAFQWFPEMGEGNGVVLENWSPHIDGKPMGPAEYFCRTLEGPLHVSPGDWIIKGVKGEFYPCKPDVFEQTYEPVE